MLINTKKIYSTKNYNQFKILEGNRPINNKSINRIIREIKNGVINNPIVVNRKNEIADGQHTFHARKQLNMEILYRYEPNVSVKDVQRMNSATFSWKTSDFLGAGVSAKNENYIKLNNILERYNENNKRKVSATTILRAFFQKNQQETIASFKGGSLILTGQQLNLIERGLEKISEIKNNFFEPAFGRNFMSAYLFCLNLPKFEHVKFIKALKVNNALEKRATTTQFKTLIIEIYNRGRLKKNRVVLNIEDL